MRIDWRVCVPRKKAEPGSRLSPRLGTILRALVIAGAFAGAPEKGAAQVAFAGDLNGELTSILDGFAENEGFSGVALVAVGDSIVLHEARGMASVELDVPLRTGTVLISV